MDVGFENMENECMDKLEKIKTELEVGVNEIEALVELSTQTQQEEDFHLECLETSFVQQKMIVSEIVDKFSKQLEDKVLNDFDTKS